MREVRPHFLHTRQNNIIDGRLELEIQKQFALLQQRMRATKQPFGVCQRILPDGTQLTVSVSYNGPVPLLRAVVRSFVADGQAIEEVFEFVIENGLMLVSVNGNTGEVNLPFKILTGAEIQAHFASGELLPCRSREIIQGKGVIDEACLDFPDPPPSLDNDLLYESNVHIRRDLSTVQEFLRESSTSGLLDSQGKMYTQSASYTGLMRLACQVLTSQGRFLPSICPFEHNEAIGEILGDGIYLTEEYDVLWVRITSTGIKYWPMQLSSEGIIIQESLKTESINDKQRDWAIAILLGSMQKKKNSTEETPYPYVYDFDLDVIIDNGAPIAHSWKHSRYANQAAIVVWRKYFLDPEDIDGPFLYQSKLIQLTFDFSSDLPVAYEADDWVDFQIYPYQFNFLYPEWNALAGRVYRFAANDPRDDFSLTDGNTAPIYCYYKEDDELSVATYTAVEPEIIAESTTKVYGERVVCPGASGRTVTITTPAGKTATTFEAGGFAVPGFEFESTKVLGTYTRTERSWTTPGETAFPPIVSGLSLAAQNWFFNSLKSGILPGGSNGPFSACSSPLNPLCNSCSYPRSRADYPIGDYEAWVEANWPPSPIFYVKRDYEGEPTGTATIKTEVVTEHLFNDICLIPWYDAEALFCVSLDESDSYSGTSRHWSAPVNGLGNLIEVGTNWRMAMVKGYADDKVTDWVETEGPYGIGFSQSHSGGADSGSWQAFIVKSESVGGAIEDLPQPSSGELLTSIGSWEVEASYSNWYNFVKRDLLHIFTSYLVDAHASFGGDVFYWDGEAAGLKLESGYGEDVVENYFVKFSRWLGGA